MIPNPFYNTTASPSPPVQERDLSSVYIIQAHKSPLITPIPNGADT